MPPQVSRLQLELGERDSDMDMLTGQEATLRAQVRHARGHLHGRVGCLAVRCRRVDS